MNKEEIAKLKKTINTFPDSIFRMKGKTTRRHDEWNSYIKEKMQKEKESKHE